MSKETKGETLAKGFALPKNPRRTDVPETAAKKFENAESGADSSKLRRPSRGDRISAYLPPNMAEELRVRCARERRSVSDAVTEAIKVWLEKG